MYLERNYERALSLGDEALRKSSSADNLEHMVDLAEGNCGQLKELKAESYRMTPGATMELFYQGSCAKGSIYYRLVMAGDSVSGYRVSGVWFKDSPYPEDNLRRQFETNIVVN